jgi:DNA helicase II / ATP-dependent DNA helicase PcrA
MARCYSACWFGIPLLHVILSHVSAVERGTFPFYRSEDVEEERFVKSIFLRFLSFMELFRRLLYVACTRAQGLLYLSYVSGRKVAGARGPRGLSQFVSVILNENEVRGEFVI